MVMNIPKIGPIVTVTLNPTIDRVVEVPGFHVGGHLKGRLRYRIPAGKAINVSRVLAAMGVAHIATGWVGGGDRALFDQQLVEAGVESRFVSIAGQTRENITIVDPEQQTETHIRDRGPDLLPGEIEQLMTTLDVLAQVPQSDDGHPLFVFTGSLAPGLKVDTFVEMLEQCRRRSALVVVDTSGEPLKRAADCRPFLVKPNASELADIYPCDPDNLDEVRDRARTLSERVDLVLLSLGKDGAALFSQGQSWSGCADLGGQKPVSTVGCGDTLLAGFLAGLVRTGNDLPNALRQALAAASASALSDKPATFRQEQYRQFLEETQISQSS